MLQRVQRRSLDFYVVWSCHLARGGPEPFGNQRRWIGVRGNAQIYTLHAEVCIMGKHVLLLQNLNKVDYANI